MKSIIFSILFSILLICIIFAIGIGFSYLIIKIGPAAIFFALALFVIISGFIIAQRKQKRKSIRSQEYSNIVKYIDSMIINFISMIDKNSSDDKIKYYLAELYDSIEHYISEYGEDSYTKEWYNKISCITKKYRENK